jgi:hypothetical protein
MPRRLLFAAEILLLALAAWQVWEVGAAMAARFGSPFDLEWMEGATLITGLRASEGLPFYTRPSPDYIPFIYPPLYAWVLGALSHLWPIGYELGRGVSIASTVVATAALAIGARLEGVRWPLAIGCAALFVGCYEDSGTFYDLVRTDALAMALTGLAIVVSRGPRVAHTVVGGLLLCVAFMAKQHAAMFGFPIAIALWRRDGWRRAGIFALASAVPALLFTVAMQTQSDGLFLTYLVGVPAHHDMVAKRLFPNFDAAGRLQGAQMECWRALPLTTTVALALAFAWPARTYWIGVSLTAFLTASLMRGHQGGYLNVLMPMMWVQALFPAFVARAVTTLGEGAAAGWRAVVGKWGPLAVTLLVAAQIAQGRSPLARYLPRPGDAAQARALVAELAKLPEPMLIPHAPWYAVMAGKKPSFALITLWDIDHPGGPLAKDVRAIRKAIAQQYWKTIVVPRDGIGLGMRDHYDLSGTLSTEPIPTRTGWDVKLRRIYVPRADDAARGVVLDESEPSAGTDPN